MEIINYIKNFNEFGSPTQYLNIDGIPYYINQFWSKAQRAAHSIHEISYRACFKPQLPLFFIKNLTKTGDVVLDPFMGRGTTIIESHLNMRYPIGIDANPLSILLTRPRLLTSQNSNLVDEVRRVLNGISWKNTEIDREDLLVFYHPKTLQKLTYLRNWIIRNAPIEDPNPPLVIDWIRMVAMNRLSGHSSGFFSVRTLPPNQAISIESQKKLNKKFGQIPEEKDISGIILKKTKSLLSDKLPDYSLGFSISCGIAENMSSVIDNSVSLIVTSPPFLDVVNYIDDNWLRCWFAGIDTKTIKISMFRDIEKWKTMVESVLRECCRVLKDNGYIAFEVGEVRGGKILLEKIVWEAANNLPLEKLCVIINKYEFTKTANCWGVINNNKGTNTNRIVLFKRIPRFIS